MCCIIPLAGPLGIEPGGAALSPNCPGGGKPPKKCGCIPKLPAGPGGTPGKLGRGGGNPLWLNGGALRGSAAPSLGFPSIWP